MKVLIIGGGAREHAIAACFARNCGPENITVAPGNAGIAREYNCVDIKTPSSLVQWCSAHAPDLVFFGPEQPLAEGWADLLRSEGIACIGPSRAAARIETSKIFAKDLMRQMNIPTAKSMAFTEPSGAREYIQTNVIYPLVIKADGLAAGKGVIIATDRAEALAALDTLDRIAPGGVVLEEYLQGWEASIFAITDGNSFQSTLFAQDHKQLLEGDRGPNTGGMGAWCPVLPAEKYREQVSTEIIAPTLQGLREAGCPFEGFLYCGLMFTKEGPKVIEFNCRLGDPETQALLPLLKTDLTEICQAILEKRVDELHLSWSDSNSVCVVLASEGYPGNSLKGKPIVFDKGITSRIFFSGVAKLDKQLVTNGGRVLSIVAGGENLQQAREKAYADCARVFFEGKILRKDISLRENTL